MILSKFREISQNIFLIARNFVKLVERNEISPNIGKLRNENFANFVSRHFRGHTNHYAGKLRNSSYLLNLKYVLNSHLFTQVIRLLKWATVNFVMFLFLEGISAITTILT